MIAEAEIRSLEALLKELTRRFEAAAGEKSKLSRETEKLREENRRLRDQLRSLSTAASRQERIKSRLVKLYQKLEAV